MKMDRINLAFVSMSLLFAAACETPIDDPKQGLALVISGPTQESPFADPESAFVALVAEGPDITDDRFQTVREFVPGAPLEFKLPAVPYGIGRQLRVELYSKDSAGNIAFPVRGRGRSAPKDVQPVETFLVRAFVTKTNSFSDTGTVTVNDQNVVPVTDGRAGAAVNLFGDTGVLIAGGADPAPGATDIFDIKSYTNFKSTLIRRDIENHALEDASGKYQTSLSAKRAFMASAAGFDGTVAFSGGYVNNGGGPEYSSLMEFMDPKTNQIKSSAAPNPHLQFARAHHTITRLFDNSNYFMIVGGKGPQAEASFTWEIWEPNQGRLVAGVLSKPRWNHTTVRLPEKDGGYLMLIGGENDSGPLNDFEVLQYDVFSNVSSKGNPKVTCCVGASCYKGPDSTAQCASLKGQPGYAETRWEPLVRQLNGGVGRTMVSAAYVHRPTKVSDKGTVPGYNVVYIVGGFLDAAKTQPSDRVDLFNIENGSWISGPPLLSARGAAMLDWSLSGDQRGQVVIAGGVDGAGKSVATGERLEYDPTTSKVTSEAVTNNLAPQGFAFGSALSLPTGKVMFVGGASSDGVSLKANTAIRLYNPK